MRLAALNERIDKMSGEKQDHAAKIRQVVNKLKHDIDAHVRGDWSINFSDAITAATVFCCELETLFASRRGS
jgi:hypothetical protein